MGLLNFLLGLVLSAIIATLAYWRSALSSSGAVGAILVGTLIFASGGLEWGMLLVAFFITSSALSHYQAHAKEHLAEKFQKGRRRDLGQVLANGAWGALLALAFAITPQPLLFVAFVGALAAVNADTWATELGVLAKSPPRLISSGRIVAVGTSGGITLFGTFVALCGALFIGVVAFLLGSLSSPISDFSALVLIGALSGFSGSLFDSLLGATVQAIYFCDPDQQETEARIHRCGRATRLIRGWPWLDNDWVNFSASVVGSAVAVMLYWAVGR